MENSNIFFKTISKIFPFADFLHVLQLENYNTSRYFKRLDYFFFRRKLQRLEKLTWTTRAKVTLILSIIIAVLGIFLLAQFYLFFLLLVFYYIYNQNGPSFLWRILLALSLLTTILLRLADLPGFGDVWLFQLIDWLSLGVFGLIIIQAFIVSLGGRSNIPKKNKLIWLGLIGVFLALALVPLELIWLQIAQLITLFLFLSILFIPVWLGVANFLLSPIYFVGKMTVHRQAENKLNLLRDNLKVIVVAGSYGKTTTKKFIEQLLKFNHRLQVIPGNINTATGIARWILNDLNEHTRVLLVEVDGYDENEYLQSGLILQPNLVVITNVGDQHLERFGTRRLLAQAMLKLAEKAHSKSSIIFSSMTMEDLDCWSLYYERKLKGKQIEIVALDEPLQYKEKKLNAKGLSTSNQTNLRFALKVAELFEIPLEFVKDSLDNLQLPERRQSEIDLYGFSTLDDSYNISFTTAKAGLERAQKQAKKEKKKLAVLFAGIPELGKENADANREYAKLLAEKADFVVLLQTILIEEVQKELQKSEFAEFYHASRMDEAWSILQTELDPKKYYILMQPELNDLYYAL